MLEISKSGTKPKEDKKNPNNKNKKCSHLHLQNKNLKAIPKLYASRDVSVIYLYNNEINKIENLNGNVFPNLTSLYLNNNQIQKIHKLMFKKLRKLYLGNNHIAVIEGLENLYSLEELHVERQTLPDRMGLCFDPRSTLNLSRTLRILNISNNKIPSFSSLSFLKELQSIDASHCDLEDLKEVCRTIREWRYLTVANFCGNPFCKNYRYREDVIVSCYYLESLDGKEVSDNSRDFLKRLETRRMLLGNHESTSVNLVDIVDDLPHNYPPSLQKAASAQLLKGNKYNPLMSSSTDEAESRNYLCWQSLPKRRPFVMKIKKRPSNNMESALTVNKFH